MVGCPDGVVPEVAQGRSLMVGSPFPKEEIVMNRETRRQGDKEFLAEPSGKAERRTIPDSLLRSLQTYVLNSLNSLSPCLQKIQI